MDDNLAASVGLVLAGIAFAATVAPLADGSVPVATVVGAGLAAGALVAFLLRRHGLLGRAFGSPLAGVLSLGVVGYALYRLMTPAVDGGATLGGGVGPLIVGIAGVGGVVFAYADAVGVPGSSLVRKLSDTGFASGVGLAGLVGGGGVAILSVRFLGPVLGDPGPMATAAIMTVLFYVGLALVGAAVLVVRGYGFGYVDLQVPDLREAGYAVGGTLLLFALIVAVGALFQALGLPSAESSIEQQAREGDPTFLLVLVPLSWLVVGPAEELLFRNIVQKYLYESFSPAGAIVVASAIFAVVHIPQYYTPNPAALLNTLLVIFALALILGATYYRTRNLLVPIFIHGTINAIQFLVLYARLARELPAPPPT